MAKRLQALALERGELKVDSERSHVSILENSSNKTPEAPSLRDQQDVVEGYQPRKVRFAQT